MLKTNCTIPVKMSSMNLSGLVIAVPLLRWLPDTSGTRAPFGIQNAFTKYRLQWEDHSVRSPPRAAFFSQMDDICRAAARQIPETACERRTVALSVLKSRRLVGFPGA
jgi:hypothetical protein